MGRKQIFGIIGIIAKNGNSRVPKAVMGRVYPQARVCRKNIYFISFR
jgi:hypothetical protein